MWLWFLWPVSWLTAEAEVGPGKCWVPSLGRYQAESVPSLQMQGFVSFYLHPVAVVSVTPLSLMGTRCQALGFKTIFNSVWKAPCVLLSIIVHLRQIRPSQDLKEFLKKPKATPSPDPRPPASQSYSWAQLAALVSVESWSKEKVLLARSLESKHTGPCNAG